MQSPSAFLIERDIRFSFGPRIDSLDWSTAGSGDYHPNILSELTWTDIHSHQLTLEGSLILDQHFYGRGAVSYASISSGQVQDSDYDGDDRTLEYSRSISQTRGDDLWDFSAGIGPPFRLGQHRLVLAPLMGFAIHRQNLRITDGIQVIASPPRTPPLGPLDDGLNSTFQAQWLGPWVGMDLRYKTAQNPLRSAMAFEFNLEYHFAVSYTAEADWNLRSDLQHPVSFRQSARGQGLLINGVWSVQVHRRVGFSFGLKYQNWKTSSGTINIYRADGLVRQARLNSANWESTSFSMGVVYTF